MCATSAVSDYYTNQWPQRYPNNPMPFANTDYETQSMMRRVLELLDRIDKKLGDKDCMDASKLAFFKQVGAALPK